MVKIDPRTNEVVPGTPVGRDPDELAAIAGVVWVVNQSDRTVTRVSPSGEVDTIGGVPYADHLAVDGRNVWVSSFDRASVARIDTRTLGVAGSVGVPSKHAEGLAVGGGYLWITNPATIRGVGTETVSRLDLRSGKVVSTIAVRTTPIFTTFGYGSVWVSNYDDDTVSVISPGSPKAGTIPVGDGPLGIVTGYGSVWVATYWRHELDRIDPRTRPSGGRPHPDRAGPAERGRGGRGRLGDEPGQPQREPDRPSNQQGRPRGPLPGAAVAARSRGRARRGLGLGAAVPAPALSVT